MEALKLVAIDFRARARAAFRPRAPHAGFDTYRESVRATRGRVLAEALLAILVGFSVDDLHVLRVPGFAVGLAVAFLVLACGSLVHGRRLAARVSDLPEPAARARIARSRARGRAAAATVAVLFLAWLAVFSQGVPPWAT